MLANCLRHHHAWVICAGLTASLLAACGGGGAPSETPGGTVVAPTAASDPVTRGLPRSYRLGFIPVPPERLLLSPAEARPPIINARGQIIGLDARQGTIPGTFVSRGFVYDSQTDSLTYFAPESDPDTFPTSITETGDAAGFVPPTSPDFFTWSRSTGLARSSLTEGNVVYVYSSEIGLIGGQTELGTDPDNPQCGGFTWNIATRTLQEYPTFCARWMNKGGVMVGRMQDGRLATVSPDDGLQVPDSNLPPVFTTMFITDDDEIFVDLAKDTEDLKAGAAVVANGEAINIGRGLAVAPPDFILDREFAAWIRVSSNGHAIGRDTLTAPPGCFPPFVAEFFEWNRASGATPIRVEGRTAIQPRDVNRDGVVVGRVDEGTPDSRAFVWTRESGGVLLDALVSNMPAGAVLVAAVAVGDGGHIIAGLSSEDGFREVLLMPEQ